MSGLHLDPTRMAAIAEALRRQIPNVSTDAARPMIDAAGELQRLADQGFALLAAREKELEQIKKIVSDSCPCKDCQARRAASSAPASGSLN